MTAQPPEPIQFTKEQQLENEIARLKAEIERQLKQPKCSKCNDTGEGNPVAALPRLWWCDCEKGELLYLRHTIKQLKVTDDDSK